jgi:hypothetical protein
MNETIFQPWYDLYSIAIFELNPIKLIQLAEATDKAIQSRLRDLQLDSAHYEERRIMGNAQRTLAFLRDNAREHEKR